MDIFAHVLWTYALFRFFDKKKYAISGAVFGVLPDLISFSPFFFFSFFNNIQFQKDYSIFPNYVFVAYNFTHSFIIFLSVLIFAYLIFKRIVWPLLGWGLHILIDIPSHTRAFFPTPFLWPVSDLTVNGISWANKYFMIINYSLLIVFYCYILFFKGKKLKF